MEQTVTFLLVASSLLLTATAFNVNISEKLGRFKTYVKPNGDDGILFCVTKNGVCEWKSVDGSPTLGQDFNPAKDCVDIVEHFPGAKNGFYWITVTGNKTVKVWCDVHTDGGGFMLVGKSNQSKFWSVPSNASPVSPTCPEHWSSELGFCHIQDFAVQVSSSPSFADTKAHWMYKMNDRRELGKLFSDEEKFCTDGHSGIWNVDYVKDIVTETVVNTQFHCSKFGPHISDHLGWAKLNQCLKKKCPSGYAFIHGIPGVQLDKFGSFSYSANSAQSGMRDEATAFVGCHNGKCCACYGPKGGRQHYCRPDCVAINGGYNTNQVTVWFWARTRMPGRAWKRCMEFQKTEQGNTHVYHIDRITGKFQKGSCSSQFPILLNEGTLSVTDREAQEKLPSVPGLVSYRKDNQELYVNNGNKWEELSKEKKMLKLIENMERKIEKLTEAMTNVTRSLKNVEEHRLRLQGPNAHNGVGRVEIFHNGQWGTVCDDGWGLNDAKVVCRQLGYSGARAALQGGKVLDGTGTILLDEVRCIGDETLLSQCHHLGWGVNDCSHSEDAGVECFRTEHKLRLRGYMAYSGTGRVEVFHNGQWGTVCDDEWDLNDAKVVCRQLGYSGARTALNGDRAPDGTGPTWLDNVGCTGNENVLSQCSHPGWGVEDCAHREDAGVVCI